MATDRSISLLCCLMLASACDDWALLAEWLDDHHKPPHGPHEPPPDDSEDGGVEQPDLTIELNFTGSTYLVDSFIVPPDTDGAVGDTQIVELLNGAYAVYDKADGTRIQTDSLDGFWSAAGAPPEGFVVDPRVLHDPFSGRWFASSLDIRGGSETADRLLLAVSRCEDVTLGWVGFAFVFRGPVDDNADFPTLGLDGEGIYLYSNGTVVVVPKADLLADAPSIARATLLTSLDLLTPTGSKAQPIVSLDDAPLPQLVLSAYDTSAGLLKLSRVLGPTDDPSLDTADGFIIVSPFMTLANIGADQPDSEVNISAGAADLESSVVRQGDSIWGVHSVASDGRAALRWFELDAATNTLLQEGLISDRVHHFYVGSIAVNERDDVVIGFNASSEGLYVSSYAVLGRTEAHATAFGTPVLLKSGVAPFELTGGAPVARWGDYSATVVDPTDSSVFWTFQEWPSARDVWSTQITALRVSEQPRKP